MTFTFGDNDEELIKRFRDLLASKGNMSHAFASPFGQPTPPRQGDKPAAKGN